MTNELVLDDELLSKLQNFKKIYDIIVEEEQDFQLFVNTVTSIGLDKMTRDMIPEGQEWNIIEAAFNNNHEFMCDLVAEIWKSGQDVTEEQKSQAKEEIAKYIS